MPNGKQGLWHEAGIKLAQGEPGQLARRYARTASGMNTRKIATSHSTLFHRLGHTGPPSASARMVSTTYVTGWLLANACSHPGIVAIGTNAELRNVSGNSQIRPNACTDSSSPIASPVNAAMQQIATPNTTASRSMATAATKPLVNRNPTA